MQAATIHRIIIVASAFAQNMIPCQGKHHHPYWSYPIFLMLCVYVYRLGHACGHNLIAISGLACALAVKTFLEKGVASGKVVLFGTPAEGIL